MTAFIALLLVLLVILTLVLTVRTRHLTQMPCNSAQSSSVWSHDRLQDRAALDRNQRFPETLQWKPVLGHRPNMDGAVCDQAHCFPQIVGRRGVRCDDTQLAVVELIPIQMDL